MQEERLSIGRPQARESALRVVERAVRVDDSRCHGADAGRLLGLGDERLERSAVDSRVRVQEQDIGRRARPPADVAPRKRSRR